MEIKAKFIEGFKSLVVQFYFVLFLLYELCFYYIYLLCFYYIQNFLFNLKMGHARKKCVNFEQSKLQNFQVESVSVQTSVTRKGLNCTHTTTTICLMLLSSSIKPVIYQLFSNQKRYCFSETKEEPLFHNKLNPEIHKNRTLSYIQG